MTTTVCTTAEFVHRLIPVSQPEEWRKAVSGMPVFPAHTWEYCSAIAKSCDGEVFLYTGSGEDFKVCCPVQIRMKEDGYRDVVSPFGFGGIIAEPSCVKEEDLSREWKTFWKEMGFVTAYIMQHPLLQLDQGVWGESVSFHPNNVYLIDLSLSLEDLWCRMCSTHRYEIRKMRKDRGITVTMDKTELVDDFVSLYQQTVRRVRPSKVYHFRRDTLRALALSPGSLLIGVKERGRVESAGLFVYTHKCGEYLLMGSSYEGRRFSRLVIWCAIETLKEMGVQYLHLGGGVRRDDNLELFKRRFGGTRLRPQVIKQIFRRDYYDYLVSKYARGVCNNYFPPYWGR